MTWILDADKDVVNMDRVRQIIKQSTIHGWDVIAIYNSTEETIIGRFETEQGAQDCIDLLIGELNGEDRPA